MTDRPEMHTPAHSEWDQGGYCNELVLDHDGETATTCGYRAPRETPTPSAEDIALADLIAEARRWPAGLPDDPAPAASPHDIIRRLVDELEARA
ncbi:MULTISPECIES: hypothetical protein [unclassified Microbacterium]|uniref:hypothetical protein n=1 Tax=unclassified Microbacterium TaxID=2609290 RepID=UPI002883264A|nr:MULTISPECIES: hypothetical protein [unclassified Microbacterium]